MRFRSTRAVAPALLILVIACGGDDEPSTPRPDAGIGTMMLTVAGQTATVDSAGRVVAGEIGPVPLGSFPVTASFFGRDGGPAANVTPDRYTFEVAFGDTVALNWVGGTGFAGVLTTRAGGSYTTSFRLRDEDNNGLEISYATSLTIDLGAETVRVIVGTDTTDFDIDNTVPGVLPPIGLGDHAVEILFVDANGTASPVVSTDVFRTTVNSSDTNIVRWTEGEPFAGTLSGVATGIASIALRLRSAANEVIAYERVLTVIVQ